MTPADETRFARLHARALRHHGPRLVDLSFANPQVEVDPRARAALIDVAQRTPAHELQYTPYGGPTKQRRIVAERLRNESNLPYRFTDVVLTHGATAALTLVMHVVFAPGDEVIVTTPSWFDYPTYIERAAARCRFVSLDDRKHLDLDAIQAALGPQTAGIVLSQPQSPTGVVLDDAELAKLGEILRAASVRIGRPLVLVSDEAHRDVRWSGAQLPLPSTFYSDVVTTYSFGKTWLLQGLRIGYAAVSPRCSFRALLTERLECAVRVLGLGSPNALMTELASRLVALTPDWDRLANTQSTVRMCLKKSGYDVVDGQATMFVYVRSPSQDEWETTAELARRGVLVLPSGLCHERSHLRLALNVSESRLAPALEALGQVAGAGT